jgi:hypothetical protein
MRAVKRSLVALFLVAAVAGPATADRESALLKGREAAGMLSDTLRVRLAQAVKDSGADGAISVCAWQARALADEAGQRLGVKARRVSLSPRNPLNAPDGFERETLVRLAEMAKEGGLPEEVFEERREGGLKVYRYVRPVLAGPLCLSCHGPLDSMRPEVRRALESRYPDDKATGYGINELRGAVSVIIPADP